MVRFLLVVVVILFFVLCAAAMRWGWRNRVRRQSHLPAFPVAPAELTDEPLAETTGVYVGTTTADDWQDRIAVGDAWQRAATSLRLSPAGLLFDRVGASPVWIPAADLVGARTERGWAGKAMGIDGVLVVRWRLGEHQLDTGIRGDEMNTYRAWIDKINQLAGPPADKVAGAPAGEGDRA